MKKIMGTILLGLFVCMLVLPLIGQAEGRDIIYFDNGTPVSSNNTSYYVGHSYKQFENTRSAVNINNSNMAASSRKSYLAWADWRLGQSTASTRVSSTSGNNNRVQYTYNKRPLIPYSASFEDYQDHTLHFFFRGDTSNSASSISIYGSSCADENENSVGP